MKPFTQRWRDASDEAKDQPMEDTPTDPKEAPYCEVCNFPLSHCGHQDDDGEPELDCKVCQLRAAIAAQTERADRLQAEVERFIELHNGAELNLKTAEEECTRLTAELDAVRKERDGFESTSLMVFGQLKAAREQRDAAQARCAELEKLIQDAPHDADCDLFIGWPKPCECTCWKSRLTPAPPEEKRP